MRLPKEPSGRTDGRKQPVELLDIKVWRGDARGRREEDYSESHSRTGPRVSSLSGFLVGFRVVPVSGLLRLPTLVLDVFILN